MNGALAIDRRKVARHARPAALALVALALWIGGLMGPAAAQPAPTTLTPAEAREALLAPGRKAKRFEPSTLIERAAVQTLIPVLAARALAGDRQVADLRALAHGAEFEIDLWHVGEADFLAMHESRPRGAGAFIFRLGPRDPAGEALLQAPHAYFDLHTGRIAAAMTFEREGPHPRALMLNTVQRYQRGPPTAESPADVCHRPEHLFSRVTDRTLA
ncbi:MAG: hypothetical protein KC620_22915, partial [Myxococcales bacterium]|nr:hypothetical protein [Myxococcales bacterium]